MAERRVNVKLDGDSRSYVSAANRAADATDNLRQKAEKFAGKNYYAHLGVNGTAAAEANLERVRRGLAEIDGKHAQARVSVIGAQGAQRDVALIMNSLLALGPAAIAGGAAAGGAMLALGSTMGVTAAAAGVLALGFSGVGDALDKLNKAQADPTAAKLKAAKLAMDALSESGRHFVHFLDSLEPQLDTLQKAAQDGLLPGVEDGIRSLMIILPDVRDMISTTATVLGDLAARAGDALSGPFWQQFIAFLESNAKPTLESFARIIGGLAEGFASTAMAFNPMAQDLIRGLGDMAERFADWSAALSSSQGFEEFVAYVRENGPKVLATIGSIASALGSIVIAAAPLAGPTLVVIKALADTLGFIASVPGVGTTLLAVGVAFGALSLALRGMEIAKFSRVGQLLGGMPGQMGKAGDAAGMFALRMGASGEAAQGVADKTSRAARGIESAGKFALGAVAGVAVFAVAMDALSASADDAATALGQGGAAADQMRQKLEDQNPAIGENSAWWEKLNHNVNSWVYSLLGIGQGVDEAEADLAKQREGMNGVQRATSYATEAQGNYEAAVARFSTNSWQAIAASEDYRAKTREVELQQIMAAEGVDRHTAAIYAQNDALAAASNASMAADRARLTFDQTTARATETLRTHTASSLEGRDAILSVKEAAVRAAEAAGEKARKDAEATGASDGATRASAAQRDTYLELAAKVEEPLRSQLKLLADDIVAIPPIKDIKVRATGEWSAGTYVMDGKAGGGARNSAGGTFQNPADDYATGGYVRGPGTTTSDDINARLSDKEYVVKASATQRVGVGALDYINRTGQLPAFAEGGLFEVGQPGFSTMVRPLEHELTSRIAKKMADSMMTGGGNGLAWAQTQAGKPYIWGGSGPTGYDCSGFMAAIMNVMDGISPHRRRGTTATFPWPGMKPGMGPGLSVGNTRNAGGGVGHMAGTINGVNVESRGGDGVVVGPRARGAQDRLFNSIYHYIGTGNFAGGSGAIEGGGLARQQVQAVANRYGWGGGPQWNALNALIGKESTWDPNAANPTSSARGLFQKMTSIWGPVEQTPGGQAEWGLKYIRGRYGSPAAAWAFHQGHNYYDDGGVASGKGYMPKNVVAPERVLSPRQTVAFEQLVDVLARPRPVSYVPSPGAGGAGGSSRSVTIKNENHFRETVDLDLFNARQEFAISSASF